MLPPASAWSQSSGSGSGPVFRAGDKASAAVTTHVWPGWAWKQHMLGLIGQAWVQEGARSQGDKSGGRQQKAGVRHLTPLLTTPPPSTPLSLLALM